MSPELHAGQRPRLAVGALQSEDLFPKFAAQRVHGLSAIDFIPSVEFDLDLGVVGDDRRKFGIAVAQLAAVVDVGAAKQRV